MVLLSIFFTRIRSTEDHQQIVLYSFYALALHLAVKICFKSFCERFEHVGLTYICRLYFLRMPTGLTTLCYAAILLSENIPNILT